MSHLILGGAFLLGFLQASVGFASSDPKSECYDLLASSRWKLIRDRMPDIYAAEGDPTVVAQAAPQQMRELLLRKLREEVAEFTANPSAEEIADIQEVLEALQKEFQLTPEQVQSVRDAKNARKGAFTKGYVMKVPGAEPTPPPNKTPLDD